MKKLIIGMVAALVAVVTGCKSVPTDSQMYTTSYAVGTAAGLVANMTKIDDTSRNAVIDIMNEVAVCIPETNQTFTAAWTPIANAHIAKLVEAGKIDAGQGVLIAKTFNVAVNGIDYLFNVRYPKARQYQDLVSAATHGFCDGFLTTFKPVNSMSAVPVQIDEQAFEYLKNLR